MEVLKREKLFRDQFKDDDEVLPDPTDIKVDTEDNPPTGFEFAPVNKVLTTSDHYMIVKDLNQAWNQQDLIEAAKKILKCKGV